MFFKLLLRELQVLKSQSGLGLQAMAAYALMVSLFPFLLGPWPHLLAQAGPAFIWLMSLMIFLMVMPQIFQKDVDEGGIDLLRTTPFSPLMILSTKGLALILGLGLPLLLVTICLSLLYDMGSESLFFLWITLALSFPLLISFVLFGSILGASSQTAGSFFIVFLILPFTLPLVLLSLQVIEEGSLMGSFRLILALNLVMIPFSLGMASYMMRDVFAR
ncbi:Cytochrome c maturation protein B [Candidatus Bealeia paramacronuclearis]|uniref:Cytochrome c maturation protein B n=2 Tax=Candidatus Bealeia paramacronuclearis TaxID=1921001 RepID=A0ABZ2C1H0_9PROT|nr:Cytochrome c maturation protein B [Candidatus Bealeia paramacronuclearis]